MCLSVTSAISGTGAPRFFQQHGELRHGKLQWLFLELIRRVVWQKKPLNSFSGNTFETPLFTLQLTVQLFKPHFSRYNGRIPEKCSALLPSNWKLSKKFRWTWVEAVALESAMAIVRFTKVTCVSLVYTTNLRWKVAWPYSPLHDATRKMRVQVAWESTLKRGGSCGVRQLAVSNGRRYPSWTLRFVARQRTIIAKHRRTVVLRSGRNLILADELVRAEVATVT